MISRPRSWGGSAGREMVLDAGWRERIAEILRPLMSRWPGLDPDAVRASNRKQAVIPAGATVLDPVGTAPGLVVPPREPARVRPWSCCRGRRASFSRCGRRRSRPTRSARRSPAPPTYRRGSAAVRDPGVGDRRTLRAAEDAGLELEPLEITTCLRRGEIEVATRYEPAAEDVYEALVEFVRERHADTLFSEDGSTIDEQVAALLAGRTIAVAESCTGGLMAARLTERAGSSAYFAGGVVAYSNEAKIALVGRRRRADRALRRGLDGGRRGARGRRAERFGAEIGVGITGIAGPDGGTEEKPVGLVCFSVARATGGGSRAARGCRAAAPTFATARRRSRCTWCAGAAGRGRRSGDVAGRRGRRADGALRTSGRACSSRSNCRGAVRERLARGGTRWWRGAGAAAGRRPRAST